MSRAARTLDPTAHPGVISGPGVPTVLIGGRPAAAGGEAHTCSIPSPAGPHPPSVILKGSVTVVIAGRSALRVGDLAGCGSPISVGCPTVEIGG